MFKKFKEKEGAMKSAKETLMQGVCTGMKYAGDRIVNMSDYMNKNNSLNMVKDRVQKHPASGILTLIGLGVAVVSIIKLMRK